MVRALAVLLLVMGGPGVGPAAADTGPWGWPLAGVPQVSRAFAPPAFAYGAGHRGADLAAAPGAVVRAAAAGRVTYAGLLAGRGVVVVAHGALRTTYEPVAATVRVGQAVVLGEPLGTLSPGHAGCPAAACLHWGLRRGEEYLDPVRLVQRGPVRLLPLDGPAAQGLVGHGSAEPGEHPGSGVGLGGAGAEGAGGAAGADRASGAAGAGGVSGAAGAGEAAGRALEPPPAVRAADEPWWSLRAAEAPYGAAALVALVVGIGLLARPRPRHPEPPSGGVAAPAAAPVDGPPAPSGTLLDLDQARARRQAAS